MWVVVEAGYVRKMLGFDRVSFGYPGGPKIFAGLNLQLREGCTTAVMGPSGSGKTTLLKLACGLLKPLEGNIYLGKTVVRLGSVRGIVFHEDTLLPWLTAIENVLLVAGNSEATRDRAKALLTEFGVGTALQAYPHELSEGMRKRVEFARALFSDEHMLLLDEPFVSLDRDTRRHFWDLWRESDTMRSRTRMIITHDVEEVRAIADEVLMLSAESPVTVGPVL